MVIERATHAAAVITINDDRDPEHRPRALIDVREIGEQYLAVAPWNRRLAEGRQMFKGIGQLLLRVAMERSEREGRGRRVGLHSEPDPNTLRFYSEKARLESRGPDPDQENREYFEGTPFEPARSRPGGSHGT